jgi:TP901 family phage tail tape measure protein
MPNFIVSTIFKGKDLLTPIFKRQGKAAIKFGSIASQSFTKVGKNAIKLGGKLKNTLVAGLNSLTSIFKRQGKAAGRFGDRASRSFARAGRSASRFGDIVKGILVAGAIQRGLAALTQGLRSVTEEFVDFDAALTQAGAKFPQVIKRGTDSFEKLGATARKVGAETQFSAADAARGLDFLAMAGFNAEQAMLALPGITDLATIANTDLARSTDIASDALGAFNLMTKDSAQLEKNLSRVTDVMAATVTSANTDIEQLFETMKFAGPVATAAGASIETFNTFAAKMADAGIKGSLSGTALRTAFLNLSAPVPKATNLLKQLRIEISDSSGNMRDMMDIMDDVRQRTAKMGSTQRTAALNTLFGKRAVAGMSVILNTSSKQLREFRANLENAGGSSKRMAGDIRKSIGNRLKELKSSLIEVGFKFLEAFVGSGEKGLDALISAIRRFDVKPIVNGVKSIIRVIEVSIDGFKIFAEALGDLKPLIIAITGAVVAAKIAQWAWNAAMLANPIGILIAAVAAAVVVIVILANKWNSAMATIDLAILGIRNTFLSIFESIKSAFISFANFIIDGINRIFGALGVGFQVEKFKLPDESAKIERQIGLIKARNALLVASVKDSEALQKKAFAVGESIRGREKAAAFRQMSAPEMPQTQFAPVQQSIDPELIRQQMSFQGEINLKGAPEGSTFQGKTRGAPPIQTNVLGANL